MLFDTHVHLNDLKYEQDLSDVISRAQDAGVSKMCVVGYDSKTNKKAIELAETYDFIYAAVGWHPVDAKDMTEADFELIKQQVRHEKVVAVGECGLDYYWDKTPRDIQERVFVQQIELAREVKKPLSIHTRDSLADTLALLKKHHANEVGGIMHCYSGSAEMMHEFIKLNFKISLAGPVTFKNGRRPQEVATQIPLDSLLIETDAPYLTPHPYRGTRNEPAYVKLVAQQIADLKGLSYEEVANQTTQNACKLFNIN